MSETISFSFQESVHLGLRVAAHLSPGLLFTSLNVVQRFSEVQHESLPETLAISGGITSTLAAGSIASLYVYREYRDSKTIE